MPIADIEKLTGTSIDIGRWNISTFGRLFEASLLPEWVEKVIHVDCDTMIMSSLEPLWNTDMTGKTVAGALECIGDNYKTEIGLKPEDTYINAGNIMLNLKKSERTAQKKNLRNTFPHILNFLLLTRQCSTLAFRAVKNSLYPLNTTHIQWFIMLNTKTLKGKESNLILQRKRGCPCNQKSMYCSLYHLLYGRYPSVDGKQLPPYA